MSPSPAPPETASAFIAAWKDEIRAIKFDRVAKMERQYVKQTKLGAGAFGEGWLCEDVVNKRKAVVKISHTALVNEHEEFAAKKEVALMEAMDHPNVVKFYEAWVEVSASDGERLHIAMEYCDAGDLGALLKKKYKEDRNVHVMSAIAAQVRLHTDPLLRGHAPDQVIDDPDLCVRIHRDYTAIAEKCCHDVIAKEGPLDTFPLATIESWTVQLLWGLWYIHKKRVVHRDIKPDNIFLAGGGTIIKIGDFGISGLQAHTNAVNHTRAGTPICMAPEMWDNGAYNDRVDVFSVGCLLYELCGLARAFDARLPYAGSFGNAWSAQRLPFLKHQICLPGIKPVVFPPTQIERSMFEIVRTMLRKNPKLRPTAGQVLRSIRMQRVARRVIEVFQCAGADAAPDPLLHNSDRRHNNAYNPANNQATLHQSAKFMASAPDAEVLMMVQKFNLTLRRGPGYKEAALGYITLGDIIEVGDRIAKDGVEWLKTQSGWCITAHNGVALLAPCKEKYICRDAGAAEGLGAYEPVLKDVTGQLAGALKDRIKTVRSKSPIGPARVLSRPPSPPSPLVFGADGRAVPTVPPAVQLPASHGRGRSPLQQRQPSPSRAVTPERQRSPLASPLQHLRGQHAAVGMPRGFEDESSPAQGGSQARQHSHVTANDRTAPSRAPSSMATSSPTGPPAGHRNARSEFKRHVLPLERPREGVVPAKVAPPGTPTGGAHKAKPKARMPSEPRELSLPRGGSGYALKRKAKDVLPEAAAAPGPTPADSRKEELRRYRHLILGVLGRDRARTLLTEYFERYQACTAAKLLGADGTCAELEAFEKTFLQDKLGNDARVLTWIRDVARMTYA